MRFYEDLDEIQARVPVTDTREWLIEEQVVRKWFKDNPRLAEITVVSGERALEGFAEAIMEDWPHYVDFDH